MAPLHQAISVRLARTLCLDDGESKVITGWVYEGDVDKDWTVKVVPNGGYVLGLIIEAALQRQLATTHPDLIHVTAHFIKSASVAPFEVHIRILKSGRAFSNLTADFIQEGSVRVMTHMIFGTLALPANTPHTFTISPPSPYARRIPMHTHPSKCPLTPPKRQLGFTKHIQVEDDPIHASKYFKNLNIDIDERPREGMEYGIYLMLKDRRERLTPPAIAFMADTFKAFDEVIPGIHSKTRNKSWAPTMTMTLEFKFPIPTFPSPHHSSRTVAIFSSGKFINDPQGRHDTYVEVWTAPSDINEGQEKEGWKEQQRCLCVATQMALLLPIEVNLRQGRRSEAAKL